MRYIQPGKPIQNARLESFNGKFRDACLNVQWFVNLADARHSIEAWRIHYNRVPPHSALGFVSLEQLRLVGDTGCCERDLGRGTVTGLLSLKTLAGNSAFKGGFCKIPQVGDVNRGRC